MSGLAALCSGRAHLVFSLLIGGLVGGHAAVSEALAQDRAHTTIHVVDLKTRPVAEQDLSARIAEHQVSAGGDMRIVDFSSGRAVYVSPAGAILRGMDAATLADDIRDGFRARPAASEGAGTGSVLEIGQVAQLAFHELRNVENDLKRRDQWRPATDTVPVRLVLWADRLTVRVDGIGIDLSENTLRPGCVGFRGSTPKPAVYSAIAPEGFDVALVIRSLDPGRAAATPEAVRGVLPNMVMMPTEGDAHAPAAVSGGTAACKTFAATGQGVQPAAAASGPLPDCRTPIPVVAAPPPCDDPPAAIVTAPAAQPAQPPATQPPASQPPATQPPAVRLPVARPPDVQPSAVASLPSVPLPPALPGGLPSPETPAVVSPSPEVLSPPGEVPEAPQQVSAMVPPPVEVPPAPAVPLPPSAISGSAEPFVVIETTAPRIEAAAGLMIDLRGAPENSLLTLTGPGTARTLAAGAAGTDAFLGDPQSPVERGVFHLALTLDPRILCRLRGAVVEVAVGLPLAAGARVRRSFVARVHPSKCTGAHPVRVVLGSLEVF